LIAYIKGTVEAIGGNYAVVEAMGIGWQVFVTKTAMGRLKKSVEIKIHTYMNVKEDSVQLFGFLDTEELEMFNMLNSVPGVGPKMAMAVLDSLTPSDITQAVLTDDYERLSKAQGVGKKTAQMMTLRLKDKLGAAGTAAASSYALLTNTGAKNDAAEALAALGYGRREALKAVLESALPDMTTEQILKAALRKLSK
jgi:Holliday junction DNA helicase RuvA